MITTSKLKEKILNHEYDERFLDIYSDETMIPYQTNRYVKAIEKFEELYGENQVTIFSAPGRSEICGNHTDHQHGEILAASINLDAIAIVQKIDEGIIKIVSDGYPEITIDLENLSLREEEKESTTALIKGVLAGAKNRGYNIGGFKGYITSDVLIGAGLSSSAAFETLIGTIISYLYNDGILDAITNAIIGQYAENVYFGKPCGLMDQMACSVGCMVHVDFADTSNPVVERVDFDLNQYGYSLCITDTKGSHADLTDEYAAVPEEMKSVASFFEKEVLLGLTTEDILRNASELRILYGDRALLRAIHFIEENERVKKAVAHLKKDELDEFLTIIKSSGNSSFKFLQNVYTSKNVREQNVSLALAFSESVLKDRKGVCRVHGGGFAGTIQAFVKDEAVKQYMETMNQLFGEGSCRMLKIRKYGGVEV